MYKLLKYELRSRAKLMAGVLVGIILVNAFIAYKTSQMESPIEGDNLEFGLMFLVLFGAEIIAFINALISFKRELYSESGYLVFTLPKKAYYVVNTKLTAALIEMTLYGILGGGILLYKVNRLQPMDLSDFLNAMANHKLESFELFLLMYLSMAATLLLAYFSITVSRATFGNRRFGGFLAFVLFLIFSYLIGRLSYTTLNVLQLESWINNSSSVFLLGSIVLNSAFCAAMIGGIHLLIQKKVDL